MVTSHPEGSFCWMELHSTDQSAAKQFYGALFGWEAVDFPMGPDEVYTMFSLQGKHCAAACTLRKDLAANGVPSHWMLYIAVDNVDNRTLRVTELGGTVLAGPFDVGQSGRMSVIQDTVGAHVCLWQGKETPGIGIAGEPGTFCWADLNTMDRDRGMKFYEGLLSWKFTAGQNKSHSGYMHIENEGQMIGGVPSADMLPPGIPPHWMIYYMVADCAASTAKATSLGAKVMVSSMEIEGAGIMSIVNDPQGAGFALFQSKM